MASPCEILVRDADKHFCHSLARIAWLETTRIEKKYSRYIAGNLFSQMNSSNTRKVTIDAETFDLLEYSRNLYELSDGMFDITSGVLRRIWQFTANATPPSNKQVAEQLANIGFDKLTYDNNSFEMPTGMEIDFGGIGKEYAVDRVSLLLNKQCKPRQASFLVNFGGDLSACQLDDKSPPWRVGLEAKDNISEQQSLLTISHGGVATSGNTKRYLEYQGKRYGHLLNPKTGYPIDNPPLTVTTFADSCVMAGSLSSLAMLQGENAQKFLDEQSVKGFCSW